MRNCFASSSPLLLAVLIAPLFIACSSAPSGIVTATSAVKQPSMPTRPQLDAAQAARYSYAEVLKVTGTAGAMTTDPWDPLADAFMARKSNVTPDYMVDKDGSADGAKNFKTVQAAINKATVDATASGRKERIYISVAEGTYNELLYVPSLSAPITLYSAEPSSWRKFTAWFTSTKPETFRARIAAGIDAGMPGEEYVGKFGAQFKDGPASIAAMYDVQAKRGKSSIGTSGSAMVWIKNDGFQARDMIFDNTYNEERGCKEPLNAKGQCATGNHQAVAFLIDAADKVYVENGRFISNQDTLYFKSSAVGKTVRSFYNNSYVEGDVDFIFGRATAFFWKTEIKSLGERTTSVFATAPSTNIGTPYGIVFDDCDFTSDGLGVAATGETYLARQWFEGQRCSPYGDARATCAIDPTNKAEVTVTMIRKENVETAGKTIVMNSRLGKHINKAGWADWESSPAKTSFRKATYSSDSFFDNLQAAGKDPAALEYVRKTPVEYYLAEYKNIGPGASVN